MPFRDLFEQVLNPSLCTTCGACELACPERVIEFDGIVPRLRTGASDAVCGTCTDCLTVCPGRDPATPALENELFGRTRTVEERWLGIVRQMYGACSTEPEVFERSASGGSVTTLLVTSMECLELDHVLVMGRQAAQPWRSAPVLRPRGTNLADYAQSTYQLAPYLGALRYLMTERPGSRVAMVGLACHVQGMRKLQAMDTRIGAWARAHVGFIIEIACSSGTTPAGTESMITETLGLELSQVVELRYREGEYPGQMQVKTRDGATHLVPFWKAVKHFANNKTHRCLSCGDWMSGLADISVSDGDPNIFDASLGARAIAKHGRVFVRTTQGARVLQHAADKGVLEVWPLELVGLNLGLERKRNRRASYERRDVPIPAGPIPGYIEEIEAISDEEYLRTPEERRARGLVKEER